MLSFFGCVALGPDLWPIPSAVFLRLLVNPGVAEAAARATLAVGDTNRGWAIYQDVPQPSTPRTGV